MKLLDVWPSGFAQRLNDGIVPPAFVMATSARKR